MSRLKYPKKLTEQYFVQWGPKNYIPIKGETFKYGIFDFVLHRPVVNNKKNKRGYSQSSKLGWQISDGLTGMRVYYLLEENDKDKFLESAKNWLDGWLKKHDTSLSEVIQHNVEKFGSTPRYEKWNQPRLYRDVLGNKYIRANKNLNQVPTTKTILFQELFGANLAEYWLTDYGFDAEKFEKEILKTPDDIYPWTHLYKKFGFMGQQLIYEIG